jgi:hypothetical protein
MLPTGKGEVNGVTDQDGEPVAKETVERFQADHMGGMGIIEGSLSYPSEVIPEDLQVCAVPAGGEGSVCTIEQLRDDRFTYGLGYNLEVPAGDYYVYAFTPSDEAGKKAYYTEYVECGLGADCGSHKKILVSVVVGAVVTEVDPGDWYE